MAWQALFTLTTIPYALAKKVNFVAGARSGDDFVILHLTAEIPRALRTTLFTFLTTESPAMNGGEEIRRGLRVR